ARASPGRSGRKATSRPGARAEAVATRPPDPELERLLTDLESEATKAIQEREDDAALIEPGILTCAGCERGIGITETWENCEECLATYCERCRDQLVSVGGRPVCPACRSLTRDPRR
ncbi:MAG: hypothetical protein L3K06_07110, partial [Thermoplasmata archaeon]|nr:hypothetical protein [Thermoplasmata archaeon]